MPDQQDIDLRARITTEFDSSGIDAAQASVGDLSQSATAATDIQAAAAQEAGNAVSAIDTAPAREGMEKTTSSVKDLASETVTAAKNQQRMTEDGVKGYNNLGDSVDEVTKKVEKLQTTHKEGSEKQDDSLQSLISGHKNLRDTISETRKKGEEQTTSSITSNTRLLSVLMAIRSGWGAIITRVIAFTGVFGAIVAVIGIVKAAWDLMRKSADEALEKQKEADNRRRESLVAVTERLTQERIALQNAAQKSINDDNKKNEIDDYERQKQKINEVNDALIRQAKLKATLENNERERRRIQREDDLYRGKITQTDYDKMTAESDREEKQSQRNSSYEDQTQTWQTAINNANDKSAELARTTRDLASIIKDPRFLSRQERQDNEETLSKYKAEEIDSQIEALKEERKRLFSERDSTGNNLQKTMIQWELDDLVKKLDLLLDRRDAYDKAAKKESQFQDLLGKKEWQGKPDLLWDKASDLGKTIDQLSHDLGRLEQAVKTEKEKLADLKNLQEDDQKTDDLQYKLANAKADTEEKKRQAEAGKAALANLDEETKKLNSTLTEVTQKMRDYRTEQAKELDTLQTKGPMIDKTKAIAEKQNLDSTDKATLEGYKNTLEKSTSGDNAERRKMLAIINNILQSIDLETSTKNQANAQLETKRRQTEEILRKNRAAEAKGNIREAYSRVQDAVGQQQDPKEQSLRSGMDRTKQIVDTAVSDNVISPKEFTTLNATLQQWMNVQKADKDGQIQGVDQMIYIVQQALSLSQALISKQQGQASKIQTLSTQVNNLSSQISKS